MKWRKMSDERPHPNDYIAYRDETGIRVTQFLRISNVLDKKAEWLPIQVEEERPRRKITIAKIDPPRIMASWEVDADDFAEFLSEQVEKYGN